MASAAWRKRKEGPMPIDPTANAGFMWAAYAVAAVILAGYGVSLWMRARRLRR